MEAAQEIFLQYLETELVKYQKSNNDNNNNIQLFIQGAPNPPVVITRVPVVKSISYKRENNQPKIPIKMII